MAPLMTPAPRAATLLTQRCRARSPIRSENPAGPLSSPMGAAARDLAAIVRLASDQGNPKLRLAKTVSKSVSRELGNALVQTTLRSQVPRLGIVKIARP